ncbi:MAG TPA: protein phosphatase 2C domain-containing protein [Aliidongia sp.]|nr:protein phosphatase 2C domain-containing protein [Aliidongia sp.]
MSSATQFEISSAAATHVGKVRKHNEDSYLARPEIGLWVVADGMGGHQAGDLASQTIVQALGGIEAPSDGAQFIGEVRTRLAAVNDALLAEAAARGNGAVIGSTVVALLTFGSFFACVWAGDSRLYRLRDGVLLQMNRDHSQVQEMVDAGLLAPELAESHPLGNVITRAVGVQDVLELDKVTDQLAPGDLFLLCSDGLSKTAGEADIARILHETQFAAAPERLIEAALQAGGNDNVTVIAVRIGAPRQARFDESNLDITDP